MSSDKLTWTLTGATMACVLAVYVASAPRAVPGGDSEGLAVVYVRVRHTATDEALHMHLELRNMERVNRFACVCVRLSARGSGEPCAMEENERVA
ncbi:hypothetical protein DPX16_19471 [Anabarilius grahami]|uniref:Secreted protein n=1 Tax=Anabarilius grahami TaxID=495550 RepID=A0A3N0Z113_ANAGA|nr:hypothetical protein DPX16_19471 [Anabarilius grahami]